VEAPEKKKFPIGPYIDLGMQLAVAVGIGFALGYLADGQLHTQPLFLVLGVLLGATSGMWTIYHAVYPTPKDKN
jgi:F0F1-type ATP synthase assembly protein I